MPEKEEFAIQPMEEGAAQPQEVVEEANPETPEEEATIETESVDAVSEVDDVEDTVEYNGKQYTASQLEDLIAAGAKVREYESSHPGFDPSLMHKDYTKKSMELADVKRKLSELETKLSQPVKLPQKIDPNLLKDVNPKDVEIVEKILQAGGYVKKDELQRENYETVKKRQVSNFIKKHPEYHPDNDPGDSKWTALRAEFNLYKLPKDASVIGELLERAHKSMGGSAEDSSARLNIQKAKAILAQKKVNKVGQSSNRGSSVSGKAKNVAPDKLKHFLKGYSDEELQSLVN